MRDHARSSTRVWLAAAVLVLAAGGGARGDGVLKVGDKAPAMVFESVNGLGEFDLEKHRGRIVVVEHFAAWCPSCVGQIDEFRRFKKKYGDKVVIVAVSVDDDRDLLLRTLERKQIDWPVCFDGRGWNNRVFVEWVGGQKRGGVPRTAIVGPDGTLLRDMGGDHLSRDLTEIVEKYFPEGAASAAADGE